MGEGLGSDDSIRMYEFVCLFRCTLLKSLWCLVNEVLEGKRKSNEVWADYPNDCQNTKDYSFIKSFAVSGRKTTGYEELE